MPWPPLTAPAHACTSRCDNCHTQFHCAPATHRYWEMLLCWDCYRHTADADHRALHYPNGGLDLQPPSPTASPNGTP